MNPAADAAPRAATASAACAAAPAAAEGAGPEHFRPMQVGDLDAVLAIEVLSYSHPWSRGNFIDSLAAGYRAELLCGPDGAVRGYSLSMPGVDESHLLNLTVAPAHRRAGLGLRLLARVAAAAQARGDQRLWLEVRASNTGAQALYRHAGFQTLGLRRGYYPAERLRREDAVVMGLDLPARAEARDDRHGDRGARDTEAPGALD